MEVLKPEILTKKPEYPAGTYIMGEEGLSWLRAQIEAHNRRARKLGQGAVGLVQVNAAFWLEVQPSPDLSLAPPVYRAMQAVRIEGALPRIAGWHLLATLQHEAAGTIIRRVPGVDPDLDLSAAWSTAPPWCAHCGVLRQRKDTWLLRHDDGTIKQVGSSCITDFLGGTDPAALLKWAEFLDTLDRKLAGDDGTDDDYWGGGAPQERGVPLDYYLTVVAAVIRHHGWVSRSKALYVTDSTASQAEMELRERMRRGERYQVGDWRKAALLDLLPADAERAAGAIAWARTAMAVKDEYTSNLHIALTPDVVPVRSLGIVASVFVGYNREQERRAQEAARPYTPGFLAPEGRKTIFTAVILGVREIPTRYGVSYLYTMYERSTGRRVKWFASREQAFVIGNEYTLEATIKAHEPYEGKDWTQVTRCTVLKGVGV